VSGVIPEPLEGGLTPTMVKDIREWYSARGAAASFDIVVDGETAPNPDVAAATVLPWSEAGATWWMETQWTQPRNASGMLARFRKRVEAGPPRLIQAGDDL
jgi:hypothetical protein